MVYVGFKRSLQILTLAFIGCAWSKDTNTPPMSDLESMLAEDSNEGYVITDKEHLTETTITVA